MNFKYQLSGYLPVSAFYVGAAASAVLNDAAAMERLREMVELAVAAGVVKNSEPGPREWSPRTDPRYCRKTPSRG